MKPRSNISLHLHDNGSLSTSEGTCLYCKQTSLGNWPVFFLYLIFHLLKGFASKRNRLQVCTFSFFTSSPFVSERGRSWRLKFSQPVTLTMSQREAEYLCVPVSQHWGHDQHVARLFPFSHTSRWKEETNTFHEANSNCRINPQNYLVPVKNESEKKDCFQNFSLKTNVPIIEIVMAERGPYQSSR